MAQGKRTSYPPVNKELRPVVKYLRDVDNCSFLVGGGKIKVISSSGKPVGNLSSRGKANDVRALAHSVHELQRQGLLAGYGKEQPRKVAAPAPPPAAATPAPPPPEPVKEVPPVSVPTPEPARPATVPPLAKPVRPHTAHQYRLDQLRSRVLRCLQELGGNNAEVRGEFVRFALAEAERCGLALPQPGKLGGESSAYESLRQSLRNYLLGKGQSQRNLDIYEAAVLALEAPKPATVVEVGYDLRTGKEVVNIVEVPGVVQQQNEDGQLEVAVVGSGGRARIEGGRSGTRGVGVQVVADEAAPPVPPPPSPGPPPVRKAPDEVVGAQGIDAHRSAYLAELRQAATDGDTDARDRLERYLGLG